MLQIAGKAQKQTAEQQVTPQGLKKLIVKLRWAGLDREAEELCDVLEGIAPEDCLPVGPTETD
ncbi:MAG: hypothetical protein KGL97_02455 [Alphaproteobacteria bacterium]|nr:hypothetical protein [Alphaproteobacteria bacterium]